MFVGFLIGIFLTLLIIIYYNISANYWLKTDKQKQHFTTKTKDGWILDIYHYPPHKLTNNEQNKANKEEKNSFQGDKPIILCHGLGENPIIWELGAGTSWVDFLSNQGFDVWTIGLRGTGSSYPSFLNDRYGWGWNIDTHIRYDIPAFLDSIEKISGQSSFHWIGHGIGGSLLPLYLTQTKDPRIKTCSLLGSEINEISHFFNPILKHWFFAVFPIKTLSILTTPFFPTLNYFLTRYLSHPQKSRRYAQTYMTQGVTNISTSVLQQQKLWIENEKYLSANKNTDYSELLAKIDLPLLSLSASKHFSQKPEITLSSHLNSSQNKQISLEKSQGYQIDYKELDILLSPYRHDDIFPIVKEWLLANEEQ